MKFRRPRRTMRVDGVEVPKEELDARRKSFRTPREAIRRVETDPDRPVPDSERLERGRGEIIPPRRRRRNDS